MNKIDLNEVLKHNKCECINVCSVIGWYCRELEKQQKDIKRVWNIIQSMDCNKDRDCEDYLKVGCIINIIGKYIDSKR